MSEHDDLTPDPIDAAYAEAEARLDDAEARAVRRARLLAAVESEAAPQVALVAAAPAAPPPSVRKPSPWARGGWLAAACAAGLGLFFATQVVRPVRPPPPNVTAPARAPEEKPAALAPPPAAPAREPPPPPAVAKIPPIPSFDPAPISTTAPSAPLSEAAPVAPPPPPPPEPTTAAPAAAPQDVVVTAERRAAPPASSEQLPATVGEIIASPPSPAARLLAAAATGQLDELKTLLAQGVPVDAADAEGNTALMLSVQADQPAAAALLRRHGASLGRKNKAGRTARDMAADQDDPALDQALGLSH